jgi:hypothetical protein
MSLFSNVYFEIKESHHKKNYVYEEIFEGLETSMKQRQKGLQEFTQVYSSTVSHDWTWLGSSSW